MYPRTIIDCFNCQIDFINTGTNSNIVQVDKLIRINDYNNSGLIAEFLIYTKDNKSKLELGEKIHSQLKGNLDYIDNAIVLDMEDYYDEHCVSISFFSDCNDDCTITI